MLIYDPSKNVFTWYVIISSTRVGDYLLDSYKKNIDYDKLEMWNLQNEKNVLVYEIVNKILVNTN